MGRPIRRSIRPAHATASTNCTRPLRATDMGFVASAHYPYIQKAEHWDSIPNPQDLRGYLMSKQGATFLIFTFLSMETAFAQPPARKFDDPGSPPFKVSK